jgi:hypothetical protein
MSMVCKQWAAVTRYYSMRYKTISSAVCADSSIAITRILQEGVAMGGSPNPSRFPNSNRLCAKGGSFAFAKATKPRMNSIVPWLYVSRRGVKYADWLESNGYNTMKAGRYRSLALGDKAIISTCSKMRNRSTLCATILYANGHHKLCWPLTEAEASAVLEQVKLIDPSVVMSLLTPKTMITPHIFRHMSAEQVASRLWNYIDDLFPCDTREKYNAVLGTIPCYMEGEVMYNSAAEKHYNAVSMVKKYKRPELWSVFASGFVYSGSSINISPENVGEWKKIMAETDLALKCIVGHHFVMERLRLQTPPRRILNA